MNAIGARAERGRGGSGSGEVAVVAVTRAGSALALRIARALPHGTAHVPGRFLSCSTAEEQFVCAAGYEGRVAPVVAEGFATCRALVLVMAAGAAVRLTAPHLRDKSGDPAVVVVDDAGRFAIALTGGHTAGANTLAETIAGSIGATPVLTTATEAAAAPPIEAIAHRRHWRLEPGSALTHLLAALVNGDRVGLYQDAGDLGWIATRAGGLEQGQSVEDLAESGFEAAMVVTDRALDLPAQLAGRTAVYRPPVLVLGIGCSRGVDAAEIAALVDATLEREQLSPLAVAAVATIDRRRAEPGLCRFAAARGWELVTRPAQALAAVSGDWVGSEAVRQAIGIPAVAEPAALAVAGVSGLLLHKVKSAHATLAIARSPVEFGITEGEDE